MSSNTSSVLVDQVVPIRSVGRVLRPGELPHADPARAWLIENIWCAEGVGIVGGPPKAMKTWAVAEAIVAVASGTPFLGVHAVAQPGMVLAYFAEDGLANINQRLRALASAREVTFEDLPFRIIEAPRVLLDNSIHFAWLEQHVREIRPKLLVLDPLVRIFSGNEDDAGHIAKVLGLLRKLQREYHVAIMLVHHVRKGANVTTGASLRGSGDLHAWGDSNIYVTKIDERRSSITVEHRSARAPDEFAVRLDCADDGVVLGLNVIEVEEPAPEGEPPLDVRVVQLLTGATTALGLTQIQTSLHAGRSRLSILLKEMVDDGRLEREGQGYRVRTVPAHP